MSDEETPKMPTFREMMGLGPPPTPSERLDVEKRRQARFKAALPHVQNARAALRELDMLGYTTRETLKAKRALALEQDGIEASLVWPVDP